MGRGFFNYDGPLMSFLNKVADVAILNIITLIFCLPLVTIGASVTAAHYAALKTKRDEGHVVSNFWKSFKMNFKQSTVIWIVLVICYIVNIFSLFVSMQMEGTVATISSGIVCAAIIFLLIVTMWVYPIQSKFVNTVLRTFKMSFIVGFRYIIRSIYMIILHAIPILVLFFVKGSFPIIFLFGIGAPIYLSASCYHKVFEKFEDEIRERERKERGEDEILEICEEEQQ